MSFSFFSSFVRLAEMDGFAIIKTDKETENQNSRNCSAG